ASRAITFIDNHDTGSTLNHWPFPSHHLQARGRTRACEGYAYILLHPGTPCVFVDHITGDGNLRRVVLELMNIRRSMGISARSKVAVRKAAPDVYAATIDDKVAMKIGRGDWSPSQANLNLGNKVKEWKLACSGQNMAVWIAVV
ncbi:MAG: PRLI-interacting factor E, partial [Monoraphidium minutum]